MIITVKDFRQISHHLSSTIVLDGCRPLATTPTPRVARNLQICLQKIPIMNRLPCSRYQQLNNHKVKNALLLAVAQEYGVEAARDIGQSPEYHTGSKPLSGRKIGRILDLVEQLHAPLKQADRLPRFITDDLFTANHPAAAEPCDPWQLCSFLSNVMVGQSKRDNHDARLHGQLKDFLTTTAVDQKQRQIALKERLQCNQPAAWGSKPPSALPREQALALHGMMCSYQRLPPNSMPHSSLPAEHWHSNPPLLGSESSEFSTLSAAQQLSIVGSAAASRVGYRQAIDPSIQKLLATKRLAVPSSYHNGTLEKALASRDPRLKFVGDHLYSGLGLSAHFVIRERACPVEAKMAAEKELSLVFGGFTSHPGLFARLGQVRAILVNLCGAPFKDPLYREAAQLAEEAACYARTHGFTTFTVSGHSLGGSLAEHAMAQHPDLIDSAVVFQPFHVKGRHREGLRRNRQTRQRITVVEARGDYITSQLIHRRIKGARTIKLPPKYLGQNVHRKYHRHLFKTALGYLSTTRPREQKQSL